MYNEEYSNKRMGVIGQNGNTGEHYKKQENMFIEVFLKKDEGGCDFSKHFETHFIKNEKLHPKVKKAKNESFKYNWYDNIPFPEVVVKNKIGDIIFHQKDNNLNPSKLQEFIIEYF